MRRFAAVILFVVGASGAVALVNAIRLGTRGSDPGIYWPAVVLIPSITTALVLVGGRLWRSAAQTPGKEDQEAAAAVVASEIVRLRRLSYRDLLEIKNDDREREAVTLPSGVSVIRETQVFWDGGERQGDLRVMVDAFQSDRPNPALVTEDFIRAPDGGFVGE